MASGIGTQAQPLKSATSPAATSSNLSSFTKSGLADNFQSFLKLLTTQLQHQNPLSPLDTNQFTQQLVQFAGVEQQLKTNSELQSLVSMEQSSGITQAIGFVGHTATVDGSTTRLTKGQATWAFAPTATGTVTVDIASPTGQIAYHGSFEVAPGQQQFRWDGKGNDGAQWPDGAYRMAVTLDNGKDKAVAIPTQVSGTVEAVDLSQSPPLLTINGQSFTVSQIKSILKTT